MNAIEKIAITKIKGIGPKTCRLLLAYFGSLDQVFRSNRSELNRIPGIQKTAIEQILSRSYMQEAELECRFVEKHGIDVLWFEDESFPRRLRHCEDAPMLLYSKGNADYNKQHVISVVGTRNASHYGKRIIEDLMEGLKDQHILLVSGLAFGIDILAHRAAIEHQIQNVAVLGHGLDRIYPYEHKETAREIIQNGSLLSEFSSGTMPDKNNFPMRNRIIAGLADVTVVIEAAHKGGALITADLANSYHRDVCAFPGNIDLPYSVGCNELIRTNKAHLIRHVQDLMDLMQWNLSSTNNQVKQQQLSLLTDLDQEELRIIQYLQEVGSCSIDDLSIYCDWPQSKLATILLELEMKGIMQSLPGKIYKLP